MKKSVWDDQQGRANCCCLLYLHPREQSVLSESMVNPYSGTSSLASVRCSCVTLAMCAGLSRVAPDAWRAIKAPLRPFERAMYWKCALAVQILRVSFAGAGLMYGSWKLSSLKVGQYLWASALY